MIDFLATTIATAEACPMLVPATAVVVVVVGVGAESALGIYGTGVVDEPTVRDGWGGTAVRVGGVASSPWSVVNTGESPLVGELLVDGDCTNSVGVEGSGAVVTILNDAVVEGDAGADSVVVAGRANCGMEASISGGWAECTSASEPDAFNDEPVRTVFLTSADPAEPPLDEATVRFVLIEPSVYEAALIVAVVFVVVFSTDADDRTLSCLGGVVASGVGGCVG